MGMFSKLFGGGKEYPPLDSSTPGIERLGKFRSRLEPFVSKVSDNLEVVPADSAAYLFIGKPPGMFGIAWFPADDDREHNFKTLMKDKGLSQRRIQMLSDKLREAYVRSEEAQRYSAMISNRKVLVTLSEALAEDVHRIIQEVAG